MVWWVDWHSIVVLNLQVTSALVDGNSVRLHVEPAEGSGKSEVISADCILVSTGESIALKLQFAIDTVCF